MAVRDALETLKNRLKELDGNLVENTDGFDGQVGKVSMQGSVIGKKFILTPKDKNYSQQSLQATFNIANIASRSLGLKGVLGLLAGNGKILKHNFDYLDKNWVPKIVDETTYQTGIALKKFLESILPAKNANEQEQDEALNNLFDFIPALGKNKVIKKVKEKDSLNILFDMQELLDARLNFYEKIIKEETIAETLAVYDIKMKRRKRWDENLGNPSTKIEEDLKELSQKLQQTTSSEDCEEIKKELMELQDKLVKLKEFNEKWNQYNLEFKLKNHNNLPAEIELNDLFSFFYSAIEKGNLSEMMFSIAIEGPLNAGIASGEIIPQPPEKIATSLADTHVRGSKLIKTLNEDVQALAQSATQKKEAIEIIRGNLDKNAIISPEFKLANASLNPAQQLIFNQAQLKAFQEALGEVSTARNNFIKQAELFDGDDTFKHYLNNHIKTIDEKHFGSQLKSIQENIEKYEKAIEKNTQQIAQSTKEGRQTRIKNLREQVRLAYTKVSSSNVALNRARHEKYKHDSTKDKQKESIEKRYQGKISTLTESILEKEQQIKALEQVIKQTPAQFEQRQAKLRLSLQELEKFQAKATGHSLYDIVKLVSEEQLQQWFEIDENHEFIHTHREISAQNQYNGFNRHYIMNSIWSFMTPHLQAIRPKGEDWIHQIKERKKAIGSELAARSINSKRNLSPDNPPKGSLFAMRDDYQQAQVYLPELTVQLEKDKEAKSNYLDKKQNDIKIHQNILDRVHNKESRCQQQYEHMKVHHSLAMQRLALTKVENQYIELQEDWKAIEDLYSKVLSHDYLSLNFKAQTALLNDIEELLPRFEQTAQTTLDKLVKSKNALSFLKQQKKDKNLEGELLELIELHGELNEFYSRILTVADFCNAKRGEVTTYELIRIRDEYKALSNSSKKKEASIDIIVETLQKLATHDAFIASLSSDKLPQLISDIYKEIHEEKEQLQILTLTRLKAQYHDLYGSLRSKESLAIEKKIKELAAFDDYLTGFENTPSPDIKKLYDSIINLRNKVTDFKASDFKTYKNNFFQTLNDNLLITSKKKLSNNSERKEFAEKSSLSLNTYITNRKNNPLIQFSDAMSSIAAFFLGCFGYQTESQKRENYVTDLNKKLDSFTKDSANYDELMDTIENGKSEYSERKFGNKGQSLQTVLTSLESELMPLKPQVDNAPANV